MSANPTQNEQRLLGLCRRLLQQNEDLQQHNRELHAHVDRLHEIIRWLGREYRALRAKLDQAEQDHAVKEAAADVLLGAALDEPMSSAPGGWR
jgi:phage shock protein A